MLLLRNALMACMILCPGHVLAAPLVIDFDALSVPVPVSTQFAAQGVVFSGGIGATNNLFGGGVIPPSVPNFVVFSTGMTIRFVDPADPGVDATTDFVSFANLGIHAISSFNGMTISVRDLFGGELATATVPPVGPFVEMAPFTTSFSLPGIHALVFTQILNPTADSIVGFDDLSFNAVSPVPEPGTSLLFVVGLAGLGLVRSRNPLDD